MGYFSEQHIISQEGNGGCSTHQGGFMDCTNCNPAIRCELPAPPAEVLVNLHSGDADGDFFSHPLDRIQLTCWEDHPNS